MIVFIPKLSLPTFSNRKSSPWPRPREITARSCFPTSYRALPYSLYTPLPRSRISLSHHSRMSPGFWENKRPYPWNDVAFPLFRTSFSSDGSAKNRLVISIISPINVAGNTECGFTWKKPHSSHVRMISAATCVFPCSVFRSAMSITGTASTWILSCGSGRR